MDHCKIFILVISEDFVSSRDCLDKLAQIVQCHEKNMQKILPVFYEVNALQNQEVWDRTRDDMMQHDVPQETCQQWEDSLEWFCFISGLASEKIHNENGGKLMQAVLRVCCKLTGLKLSVLEHHHCFRNNLSCRIRNLSMRC